MKVVFYDFDGTLMNSPEPHEGMPIWYKKKGEQYPHQGWWGRAESLDLDVFDIQPFYKMDQLFRKDVEDPNAKVVLLTNRIGRLETHIRTVLEKHNMDFDIYDFKSAGHKGDRMVKIITDTYPDTKTAVFYDDDPKNLNDAKKAFHDHHVNLVTYLVKKDQVMIY